MREKLTPASLSTITSYAYRKVLCCRVRIRLSPPAVFGNNGKHTRAAVSSNSLPLGIAVEIDAIFEVK